MFESALALGDSNTLRRDDPEIALFSAVKEDWHCASAVSLLVLLRRKCTSLLQDHSWKHKTITISPMISLSLLASKTECFFLSMGPYIRSALVQSRIIRVGNWCRRAYVRNGPMVAVHTTLEIMIVRIFRCQSFN